jgi:hypothetical protein
MSDDNIDKIILLIDNCFNEWMWLLWFENVKDFVILMGVIILALYGIKKICEEMK